MPAPAEIIHLISRFGQHLDEDRGIEDYGRLRGLGNGQRIYPRLCQVFEAADARYKNLKLVEHVAANHFTIPHERLLAEAWSLKSDAEAAVFHKVMQAGKPLGATPP